MTFAFKSDHIDWLQVLYSLLAMRLSFDDTPIILNLNNIKVPNRSKPAK
jgi:hypothetical protein